MERDTQPKHETKHPEVSQAGTFENRTAEARLREIEKRITGDQDPSSPEAIRTIDMSLARLVRDVCAQYASGTTDQETATEMLLIAIQGIDARKDDDNPATNGEAIASALNQVPPVLLKPALELFLQGEGSDEMKAILSEISNADKSNFDLAA